MVASPSGEVTVGPVEEIMRSLTDREGNLEISLDDIEVRFPLLPDALRLKGTIRVRLLMKETPPSGPRSRRKA
ncbi:MAG: hypothetical protein QXG65_00560 [Thermoplasmata archaeon]